MHFPDDGNDDARRRLKVRLLRDLVTRNLYRVRTDVLARRLLVAHPELRRSTF